MFGPKITNQALVKALRSKGINAVKRSTELLDGNTMVCISLPDAIPGVRARTVFTTGNDINELIERIEKSKTLTVGWERRDYIEHSIFLALRDKPPIDDSDIVFSKAVLNEKEYVIKVYVGTENVRDSVLLSKDTAAALEMSESYLWDTALMNTSQTFIVNKFKKALDLRDFNSSGIDERALIIYSRTGFGAVAFMDKEPQEAYCERYKLKSCTTIVASDEEFIIAPGEIGPVRIKQITDTLWSIPRAEYTSFLRPYWWVYKRNGGMRFPSSSERSIVEG